MSNHKNEEGYPSSENSNPWPLVPPEIWSTPYPSLVCMQCQERPLMVPVLPSAPYPVTPDLEDVSYPICRLMSSEIREDREPVASSSHFSTNTFPSNVDVTPAENHEFTKPRETIIVSLETETEKKKPKRTYFSKAWYVKSAFVVFFVITGFLFLSALPRTQ